MTHRPDTRRVCDLSPLELLEAAIDGLARFGWASGRWNVELYVDDGHVRQARAALAGDRRSSVSRSQLEQLGSDELGSAA